MNSSTLFLSLLVTYFLSNGGEISVYGATIEKEPQQNSSLSSSETVLKSEIGSIVKNSSATSEETRPVEANSETNIKEDNTSALKPECQKHSDCPVNNCCTVGMMRYTFPSCFSYGKIDDPCLLNSSPRNFTLSYPNLKTIQVHEAFLMFCPCSSNLICDKSTSTCQLPSADSKSTEAEPQRYSDNDIIDNQ